MPQFSKDHMTLGGLIDALRHLEPDQIVFFDFAALVPTTIQSYRGYYEDLAIGFADGNHGTVGEFLTRLRDCVGITFEGYKGGNYPAKLDTVLWAANWGRTGGTAIVGVRTHEHCAVIETEMVD